MHPRHLEGAFKILKSFKMALTWSVETPCFIAFSGFEALISAELEACVLKTRVWRPFLGQMCLKPAFWGHLWSWSLTCLQLGCRNPLFCSAFWLWGPYFCRTGGLDAHNSSLEAIFSQICPKPAFWGRPWSWRWPCPVKSRQQSAPLASSTGATETRIQVLTRLTQSQHWPTVSVGKFKAVNGVPLSPQAQVPPKHGSRILAVSWQFDHAKACGPRSLAYSPHAKPALVLAAS